MSVLVVITPLVVDNAMPLLYSTVYQLHPHTSVTLQRWAYSPYTPSVICAVCSPVHVLSVAVQCAEFTSMHVYCVLYYTSYSIIWSWFTFKGHGSCCSLWNFSNRNGFCARMLHQLLLNYRTSRKSGRCKYTIYNIHIRIYYFENQSIHLCFGCTPPVPYIPITWHFHCFSSLDVGLVKSYYSNHSLKP